MLKLLGALAVFAWSSLAAAQQEVENGGDAVVCNDGQKVETLDVVEARALRAIVPELGDATDSVDDKIERALSRLQRLDPARANLFRTYVADFWINKVSRTGIDILDLPDSGHAFVPKDCEVKQLAVQRRVLLPGDKKYLIDEDLWNALGNDDKATLVLHEVIYRDKLAHRMHKNPSAAISEQRRQIARWVRMFTSYLTSTRIDALSPSEYVALNAATLIERPGGSDVVVCPNAPPEPFDAFEARELRGLNIDLGDDRLSWEEKVQLAIKRIANFDNNRFLRYDSELRAFEGSALRMNGVDLVDLEDDNFVGLPRGCHTRQLIVPRLGLAKDAEYVVNQELWDQLSETGRAVAILHELTYRDAVMVPDNDVDSTRSRYFSSQLFANTIAGMNETQYRELLRQVHLN